MTTKTISKSFHQNKKESLTSSISLKMELVNTLFKLKSP